MNLLYVGMIVRWALTVFGVGAAASSDAVKNAQGASDMLAGLPQDIQLLLGALATIISLAWSYAQKRGWIKRDAEMKAPVEERTI